MRFLLIASILLTSVPAAAYDVTAPEARRLNLLEYVEARDDLSAQQKQDWDAAIRRSFGGKALKDGSDEGVTVAKSVISAAIFFEVEPKVAAKAAYRAYHDTYRWVPPPIAINYQLMAFQGRKPKATARQLAYQFPKYFNEELAPDIAAWWTDMLAAGKISELEVPDVERSLAETRVLMRPMLRDKLWQAAQIEARVDWMKRTRNADRSGLADAQSDLRELQKEIAHGFRGVGKDASIQDAGRSFYSRYAAMASELGEAAQPRPSWTGKLKAPRAKALPPPKKPKPTPKVETPRGFVERKQAVAEEKKRDKHGRIKAPLPGEPLIRVDPGYRKALDASVDTWVGTPYLFGGTTRKGVDCSAFTRAAFRESLSIEIPRNSRAQFRTGKKVDKNALQPGDLIFFDTLDRGRVTHVAVYMGDGLLAHSGGTNGVIRLKFSRKYFQRAYWGSRGILKR